jgi:threonine synthase
MKCGTTYPTNTLYTCLICGSILDVTYDYDSIILDASILEKRRQRSIWRYSELLPLNRDSEQISIGEGATPLIKARRLGKLLGLNQLYLKDETRNPTGAFKDRAFSVLVSRAKQEKFSTIVTASSGNSSSASAAYSARAGLKCYVLFQEGSPAAKIVQTTLYGAVGLRVRKLFAGTPDDLTALLREVSERLRAYNAFCWALINPYALEGIKTISYEVAQDLSWRGPDFVVTPTGGGDNLAGQWKGYVEFKKLDLINGLPKMICVQPEGAAALARSWEQHLNHVESVQEPRTVASGLRAAYSGDHALRALYGSDGSAIKVSDEEVVEGEKTLARTEGLWVEPSSATAVAGLRKLKDTGVIESDDLVVCTLTGAGFKDMEIAGKIGTLPVVVDRDIKQVIQALDSLVDFAQQN